MELTVELQDITIIKQLIGEALELASTSYANKVIIQKYGQKTALAWIIDADFDIDKELAQQIEADWWQAQAKVVRQALEQYLADWNAKYPQA